LGSNPGTERVALPPQGAPPQPQARGHRSGRHTPITKDLAHELRHARTQRDVAPALETDHVTLRRMLVDYGHLERTADGRAYRVAFPARPTAFALDVDEIDVRATVAAYRAWLASRPKRTAPVP